MVNQVLQESNSTDPRILDIGTGSGCIAITLSHYIPHSKTDAIDIEAGAIEVARKNAARNNAAVNIHHDSILELADDPGDVQYDLIVSNPPYVTRSDKLMMHPRITGNEPESALYVSDDDPLVYYRAIAKYGIRTLAGEGAVWVEINEQFGSETSALFTEAGFKNVRLMRDIQGKNRFIKAAK
jgi:release factor glutamine methyltransferase